MSFEISFLAPEAAGYVARHVALPFAVMRRMEEEIRKEEQPAVGRGAGSLLQTLAGAAGARRIVEVGTNVGFSAMWLAAGMPEGGRIDTIELDTDIARRATENFREAGIGDAVTVHVGAALEVLPRLAPPADLVFLDAMKEEYPQYVDHALRLLRPGGLLVADNAFWIGAAWKEDDQRDTTRGVREMARRAFGPDFAAATIAPVEDGVLIAVKRA